MMVEEAAARLRIDPGVCGVVNAVLGWVYALDLHTHKQANGFLYF